MYPITPFIVPIILSFLQEDAAMKDIRRVAIAGAGTMGYSLAQAFSAAGYPVKL